MIILEAKNKKSKHTNIKSKEETSWHLKLKNTVVTIKDSSTGLNSKLEMTE